MTKTLPLCFCLLFACSSAEAPLAFTAVTFNTGTTSGLGHDSGPDDGYGSAQAALSDAYYGDGLAWQPVVEDTRRFFEALAPDVVAIQEIFYSGECPTVPEEARAGFVCETWQPEDPTVAQTILGPDYQVACHLGKPDKCLAVNINFGRWRGCEGAICLDHLNGARVTDCGGGSRVGRGVLELAAGGELTVVNVHGSSGLSAADVDCRSQQFAQVFDDLGTGDGPAANGARNLILGDLNTDPARFAGGDDSADTFLAHVGRGRRFHFVTDTGDDAEPTYGGIVNIDHVVSDFADGTCFAAGITAGHSAPTEIRYFDHRPLVCPLEAQDPGP